MTASASAPVSAHVEAEVRDDLTGTVRVDDRAYDVSARDLPRLRAEIHGFATATAIDAGGPVLLTTRLTDGTERARVHPDGRVEPLDQPELVDEPGRVDESPDETDDGTLDETHDEPVAVEPAAESDGWIEPGPHAEPAEQTEPAEPEAPSDSLESSLDESQPTTSPRPVIGMIPPPPPASPMTPPSATPESTAGVAGLDDDARIDADDDAVDDGMPAELEETAVRSPIRPTSAPLPNRIPTAPPVTAAESPLAPAAPTASATEPAAPADAPTLAASTPIAPAPQPAAAPTAGPVASAGAARPTLDDFLSSRPAPPAGPATMGWRGGLRRATGGLIRLKPGPRERVHRDAVERVQRSLSGPRTVVVINPKGGAHKTTATLLLAATFGTHRGGATLAWDNNETRGTLGWRAQPAGHARTAVDLLRDLDRFDERNAQLGELDQYVRAQGSMQFDVLASDEDAAASSTIDAPAFTELHTMLSRFYRVIVIDTGNNMRASNWEAAVDAADQLVIVSTVREDTAASAAWLVDGLHEKGHGDKVQSAVTVLASPAKTVDAQLNRRLHGHFASLTRAVVDVPHDAALVSGGTLDFTRLAPETREAWLMATATIADGL